MNAHLPRIVAVILVATVASCGHDKPVSGGVGQGGQGGPEGPGGPGGNGGNGGSATFELIGAPLTFATTGHGFGLNAVVRSGDPATLRARVRPEGGTDWTEGDPPANPAPDVAQWSIAGLAPGRRYEYQVYAGGGAGGPLYAGSAVTARAPGSAFTFAVVTDTHIAPHDPVPAGQDVPLGIDEFQETTLMSVTPEIAAADPDFMINLGDTMDFHQFGFNTPPPEASFTRLAYQNYRRLLGDVLVRAAHFPVVGNWDGENGCNTVEEIARSTSQRLLYVPSPGRTTTPQGGSANGDYYAFVWGDALFVVLNVMTYTPSCHLLDLDPGLADDWTLGAEQLAWLGRTLAQATSRWRFLFIHHTVGGDAGNVINAAYGRGGGRAAHVGEQAAIHQLMLQHGVQIFFYGHDHVFTDMVVDGIHYTLPGSAGAPWKFDASETGYTQFWSDSGYGRVEVTPDEVHVTFAAVGGRTLASYSLP